MIKNPAIRQAGNMFKDSGVWTSDGIPDDQVYPSVTAFNVFGDNDLSAAEQASNQSITFNTQNIADGAVIVRLYNQPYELTPETNPVPVAQISGTLANGIGSVTLPSTSLQLLTDPNCYVTFSFDTIGVGALIPFTVTSDTPAPPSTPAVANQSSGVASPVIIFKAALRTDDTLLVRVNGTIVSATAVTTDQVLNDYRASVTEVLADGSYPISVTVTGADGQTTTSIATLTISLAGNTQVVVGALPSELTSPNLTVTWTNPPVNLNRVYVFMFSDEARDNKVGLGGGFVLAADAAIVNLQDIPLDGSVKYLEVSTVYDKAGEPGVPDFSTDAIDVQVFQLSTSAVPQITSPTSGTNLGGSAVLNWTVEGTASGDEIRFGVFHEFPGTASAPPLFDLASTANTTETVNDLPNNGSDIYVELGTRYGTEWRSEVRRYVTGTGNSFPVITAPAQLSAVSGASLTVVWEHRGTSAEAWWVDAATTVGTRDLYSSGKITNAAATSHSVTGLPSDGSTVYITVWHLIGTLWTPSTICFTSGPADNRERAKISDPPLTEQIAGTSRAFTWGEAAYTADAWEVRVGSASGLSDHKLIPNIPFTSRSATIDSYPSDGADIYVGHYAVNAGVPTLLSERIYRSSSVVLNHGLHNGLGALRDVTGFDILNINDGNKGQLYFDSGEQDQVLVENKIIYTTGEPKPGVIFGKTTKRCTARNVVVICADNYYINWKEIFKQNGRSHVGIPPVPNCFLNKGEENVFEDISTHGGSRGLHSSSAFATQVRRIMVRHAFWHSLIFERERPINGRHMILEDFATYTDIDQTRQFSGMDNINFYQLVWDGNNSSVKPIVRNGVIIGGHGNTGSGIITDGGEWGALYTGNMLWENIVCINTGMKAWGWTSGARNLMRNVHAFQSKFSPSRALCTNNMGAAIWDFRNPASGNYKDKIYGSHQLENCSLTWYNENQSLRGLNGAYQPYGEPVTTDKDFQSGAGIDGHPAPHWTATNCQFDDARLNNFQGEGTLARNAAWAMADDFAKNVPAFNYAGSDNNDWRNVP